MNDELKISEPNAFEKAVYLVGLCFAVISLLQELLRTINQLYGLPYLPPVGRFYPFPYVLLALKALPYGLLIWFLSERFVRVLRGRLKLSVAATSKTTRFIRYSGLAVVGVGILAVPIFVLSGILVMGGAMPDEPFHSFSSFLFSIPLILLGLILYELARLRESDKVTAG